MKFYIFKNEARYKIQASDSSWSYSKFFIGYSRREIERKLKQTARERFNLKRISAEIFEI